MLSESSDLCMRGGSWKHLSFPGCSFCIHKHPRGGNVCDECKCVSSRPCQLQTDKKLVISAQLTLNAQRVGVVALGILVVCPYIDPRQSCRSIWTYCPAKIPKVCQEKTTNLYKSLHFQSWSIIHQVRKHQYFHNALALQFGKHYMWLLSGMFVYIYIVCVCVLYRSVWVMFVQALTHLRWPSHPYSRVNWVNCLGTFGDSQIMKDFFLDSMGRRRDMGWANI